MKIIDTHAHVYPAKIADKASENIGQFYHLKMRHSGGVDELRTEAKSAGITRVVINSVATKAEQVVSINNFIADTANGDKQFFTGLATIYPFAPISDIEKEIARVKTLDLRGVKMHPDFQQFKINSKEAFAVYEILESAQLPVLLHTGDSRFEFSNPKYVPDVIRRFPNLTIVAAHFGGWSEWGDSVRLLAGVTDKLYADTSSSFYEFTPEKATEIIRAFGAEQLMFGTDYPMWTASDELAYFNNLDLTENERECILYKTAEVLYR
jgi:predicted TIM-barrel fold metal-dependent hydrolase